MTNTAKDIRSGKNRQGNSSKKDTKANRKKKMAQNHSSQSSVKIQYPETQSAQEKVDVTSNPIIDQNPRDTISMGADAVAITREAIKSQEENVPVNSDDVVEAAKKVEDSARIVDAVVSNDNAKEVRVEVKEDDKVFVLGKDEKKDEKDASKPEEVKKTSLTSAQSPFEFVTPNTSRTMPIPPAAYDNNAKSGGGFFSKFVCFLVVVIGIIAVFNVLSGVEKVSAGGDHVNSYPAANVAEDDNGDVIAKVLSEGDENKVEAKDKAEADKSKADTEKKPEAKAVAENKKAADEKDEIQQIVQNDATVDARTKAMLKPAAASLNADANENKEVVQAKEDLIAGVKRSKTGVAGRESVSALIAKKSVDAGISPVLVASIVMAESYFNPKATSKTGKRGLMQITPAKEAQILKLKGAEIKAGDLYNPEYNLDLGIWYLKHLMSKYDGDLEKALMAFSWDEKTVENIVNGSAKAPRWSGLYFANIQRYYNAIIGQDGQRLALSLPVADKKAKADSIKAPESNVVAVKNEVKKEQDEAKKAVVKELEQEPWVKSVMAIGKHVSPKTKAEIVSVIKEQSLLYNVDAALISSIILSESAFDPLSESKHGKRGLFQFKPEFAKLVANTLGVTWRGDDALFEPAYNIELGVAYFQHLKLIFDDDVEKAIVAFNLTPYRISRILAGKRELPKMTPTYLNNIRMQCKKVGCTSEISDKYIKRLQAIKVNK